MSNPAPVRTASAAKRPLENLGDILPDLQEAAATRRPLWRHPAFLVSAGTTLVAIIVMVVLLLLGVLAPTDSASSLQLTRTEDTVHATWSGPDIPYDLYVVGGPKGDVLDITQLVTGREAWIPAHSRLIDDDACLVVRPAERNAGKSVGTAVPELEGQGAVRACIENATSADAEGADAEN